MSFRRLAASVKTINVLSFGAKGDGSTDDTKAFENAWEEACSSSENVTFIVPRTRSYLLKPLRFSGPCNSNFIKMEIGGTLIASDDRSDYRKDTRHWLRFDSVENLVVEGGGTIDGNGNVWWKNSCKINKNKALTFYKCTELVVKNLKIQNGQQIHVSFERCRTVEASKLVVNAPENSPNTDGIHITATQDIHVSTCTIATGDDCISIVSGSKKVRASDITCGPGHGISIGSLGSGNSEAHVSDVVVNRAKLSGTTNGVRIKTWQGGSGSANNIEFKNIEMENVKNPIIIDQNYCDQDEPCQDQSSAVQVKNVVYENIKGTSASTVAIDLECSKRYPCQGIVLENVNLEGVNDGKSEAVCKNVDVRNSGNVSPVCPN
ncbi:UNVERIFIED_CONTAM: Polygalacturonase [Sesamum latifolium]|uniref:endo-polygalacturonase n=1 Tax=Sesamum latifolium TaxID=2727402 RepID=A0AAW2VIB3_9LAMI